jgi:hypothetical protein
MFLVHGVQHALNAAEAAALPPGVHVGDVDQEGEQAVIGAQLAVGGVPLDG